AMGYRPSVRWRLPSSGPPTAAGESSTAPSTYTAGWASIVTTPSTATSWRQSRWSSPSAAPLTSSYRWAPPSATRRCDNGLAEDEIGDLLHLLVALGGDDDRGHRRLLPRVEAFADARRRSHE